MTDKQNQLLQELTDKQKQLLQEMCADQPVAGILDVIAAYCDKRLDDWDHLSGRERQHYRTLGSKVRRAALYARQHGY